MTIRRVSANHAAALLDGVEALDPSGVCTKADLQRMCEAGECFELGGAVDVVYVVRVRNGVAWIDALKGSGDDTMTVLDAVVSEQARASRSIALQTRRRGLVRQLERRGFSVTGWILSRDNK